MRCQRKENKQTKTKPRDFHIVGGDFRVLFPAREATSRGLEVSLCSWPPLDFRLSCIQAKGYERQKHVNSPLF